MSAHDQGKVVYPMVSHGWFKRFLQQQPQLSYHRGDPTANVRMNCLSEDVIADYFALLKEELTKNKLMNSPSRIYNVDETQICLDGHAPRVVATGRNQVTVIACVSASGQCIPPFVIFVAKQGHI